MGARTDPPAGSPATAAAPGASPAAGGQERPRGWRAARSLLHGTFRTLVGGQVLGQAGDGLAQITFAQLVVFDVGKGATPARVAGVLAATLLPFTLVGPVAGVFIDRWDRRRTLVAVSAVRAAVAVAATGLAVAGVARATEVGAYVCLVLLLSCSRFILSGKAAVLPRLVAQDDLVEANALSGVSGMVLEFAAAVTGAMFVQVSVPAGFVLAMLCYLASGALFLRLPPVGGRGAGRDRLLRQLRAVGSDFLTGLGVVVHQASVRRPVGAVGLHRFLLGGGFVLLVLVADSQYHLQASGYGLALAVTGLAAFAGTVAAPELGRRYRPEVLLPLAFLPPAVAACATGFVPTLGTLLATLAVASVSFQVLKVLSDALLGREARDAVRGRVFSVYDAVYNIGFVLAGLALVPLWHPGAARELLWWLAAAFAAGWLLLAATGGGWPFGRAGRTEPGADRRARTSRWRGRALSALAGLVPVLAFPRPAWWWLAWVGLVPWLLLLARSPDAAEAGRRGWCAAVGFLLGVHSWVLPSTGVFAPVVAAALALLWVPWSVAAHTLLRRPTPVAALAAVAVLPAGWVCADLLRSSSLTRDAWGFLGASQAPAPVLLAPAAAGGVWLVTLLVVAVNTALALAVLAPGRTRAGALLLAVAALVAGPLCWVLAPALSGPGPWRLALVQPGALGEPQARFDAEERLTSALPTARYDLVVWGESSVGSDLARRPDLAARLRTLAGETGAPLLVNVDARSADGRIRKAAVLVGPRGVLGSYDKTRLVPFGEYVPLRPVLGWVSHVTKAAAQDRVPGTGVTVLRTVGLRFTPLICFESAFPDLARTGVARGGELVVVQSADSTFQGSAELPQHAALAAVRAVETGRPVVQATLTGVSAAYDARGRLLASLGDGRRGTLVVDVPRGVAGTTPYVRLGEWVPALCVVLVGAALLVAAVHSAPRTGPRLQLPPPEGRPRGRPPQDQPPQEHVTAAS
ncbi:MAG: apolipoprotein N-acyltransferase [Motilibacteraceae bacterium]